MLFFFCYPFVDYRWSRKQQRCAAKVTDFHSCCVSDVIRQVCYVLPIMQLHTHTQTQFFFALSLHLHSQLIPLSYILISASADNDTCVVWRGLYVMVDASHSGSVLPLHHRTTLCQASHPSLQLWFVYT